MKILVCFKIVNDIEQILADDWYAGEQQRVDISYANWIYNYFDEYSLELALRLKDDNQAVEITALTIGGTNAKLLKNLTAVGIDRVVRIHTENPTDFSPQSTAKLIEHFYRLNGGYDLIFTGRQAIPSDSGMIPFLLAEYLNLAAVSQVLSVDFEEDALRVRHQTDEGIGTVKINRRQSLLLSTGNIDDCCLRPATLKQKLAAKNRIVEEINAKELGLADLLTVNLGVSLVQMKPYHRERKCRFVNAVTSKDKAKEVHQLLLKYLQ